MTLERDVDELLPGLGGKLATSAELTYERSSWAVSVRVRPFEPSARPMWLSWDDHEVIIQAGEHGGRWELTRQDADLAFLRDLLESVVAGRVRETFGPRRSRVEVTMADGTVARETGYQSFLPVPGWRRRGRTVQYTPYGAD